MSRADGRAAALGGDVGPDRDLPPMELVPPSADIVRTAEEEEDFRGGLLARVKLMRKHLPSSQNQELKELIHGHVARFAVRAYSSHSSKSSTAQRHTSLLPSQSAVPCAALSHSSTDFCASRLQAHRMGLASGLRRILQLRRRAIQCGLQCGAGFPAYIHAHA